MFQGPNGSIYHPFRPKAWTNASDDGSLMPNECVRDYEAGAAPGGELGNAAPKGLKGRMRDV